MVSGCSVFALALNGVGQPCQRIQGRPHGCTIMLRGCRDVPCPVFACTFLVVLFQRGNRAVNNIHVGIIVEIEVGKVEVLRERGVHSIVLALAFYFFEVAITIIPG